MKGVDCTLSVDERELKLVENSKSKPAKHFFPLDHRRIVHVESRKDVLVIHAVIPPKSGKKGTKLKKISLQCDGVSQPLQWTEFLRSYVYGGEY